jgi:hypothetical protein
MAKSSNIERAKRINTAINLLKELSSITEAVKVLSVRYGISKRQAYRYVRDAESAGNHLPVPDQKIAFTVKLSQNLTQALRQYTEHKGQTLSEVVTLALEAFLYKGRRRGSTKGKDSRN